MSDNSPALTLDVRRGDSRPGDGLCRPEAQAAANTDVRPSLDALALAICADVGNRARLGRRLPLPSTTQERCDELVGAALGLVRR